MLNKRKAAQDIVELEPVITKAMLATKWSRLKSIAKRNEIKIWGGKTRLITELLKKGITF